MKGKGVFVDPAKWAFIAALTKYPQQSYQQLLVKIREEMTGRYSQKPQFSACHRECPYGSAILGLTSTANTDWVVVA